MWLVQTVNTMHILIAVYSETTSSGTKSSPDKWTTAVSVFQPSTLIIWMMSKFTEEEITFTIHFWLENRLMRLLMRLDSRSFTWVEEFQEVKLQRELPIWITSTWDNCAMTGSMMLSHPLPTGDQLKLFQLLGLTNTSKSTPCPQFPTLITLSSIETKKRKEIEETLRVLYSKMSLVI